MTNSRKVVVITGGSAGVGRATAREFAAHGYAVAILSRATERLEEAREEIARAGGTARAYPVDVANHEEVFRAAEKIEEELGPIDVWVNNAMTTVFSPFKEVKPEEFRRATEVTYLGAVYGTMAAMKYMLPRNCGVIVQVGSALAYRSIPLQSPYCGAKHAMKGFTDSIRSELIHDRSSVRITMVQLPALNTPQFEWCKTRVSCQPQPVPPIFQPEVAARGIYWAATHKRREVFVGFPTTKAILANKLFPGWLDKILAKKGYEGQFTNEPLAHPEQRAYNLFKPVPGHYAAHGRFDRRAKSRSLHLWLTTHRALIAGFSALLLVAAFGLVKIAAAG